VGYLVKNEKLTEKWKLIKLPGKVISIHTVSLLPKGITGHDPASQRGNKVLFSMVDSNF
jgi:hypothetical protein